MNTETNRNIDDVGEVIREGRSLRQAHAYRIQFALENLNFRSIEVSDPVPLGRQILVAAELNVHEDYSLFAILKTGDFEDVRLDEPFDLRLFSWSSTARKTARSSRAKLLISRYPVLSTS